MKRFLDPEDNPGPANKRPRTNNDLPILDDFQRELAQHVETEQSDSSLGSSVHNIMDQLNLGRANELERINEYDERLSLGGDDSDLDMVPEMDIPLHPPPPQPVAETVNPSQISAVGSTAIDDGKERDETVDSLNDAPPSQANSAPTNPPTTANNANQSPPEPASAQEPSSDQISHQDDANTEIKADEERTTINDSVNGPSGPSGNGLFLGNPYGNPFPGFDASRGTFVQVAGGGYGGNVSFGRPPPHDQNPRRRPNREGRPVNRNEWNMVPNRGRGGHAFRGRGSGHHSSRRTFRSDHSAARSRRDRGGRGGRGRGRPSGRGRGNGNSRQDAIDFTKETTPPPRMLNEGRPQSQRMLAGDFSEPNVAYNWPSLPRSNPYYIGQSQDPNFKWISSHGNVVIYGWNTPIDENDAGKMPSFALVQLLRVFQGPKESEIAAKKSNDDLIRSHPATTTSLWVSSRNCWRLLMAGTPVESHHLRHKIPPFQWSKPDGWIAEELGEILGAEPNAVEYVKSRMKSPTRLFEQFGEPMTMKTRFGGRVGAMVCESVGQWRIGFKKTKLDIWDNCVIRHPALVVIWCQDDSVEVSFQLQSVMQDGRKYVNGHATIFMKLEELQRRNNLPVPGAIDRTGEVSLGIVSDAMRRR